MPECENCTSAPAVTRCTECDEVYCDDCFQQLHRSQKKKLHQRAELDGGSQAKTSAPAASQCENCNERPASLKCGDCGESFCEPCATEQHRSAKKRKHAVTSLSGEPVYLFGDRSSVSLSADDVAAHTHDHAHDHAHDHSHDHAHDHAHDHSHDHAHDHSHDHAHDHSHDAHDNHAHDEVHQEPARVGEQGQEVQAAVAAELWTDLSAFNFELARKEAQMWIEKVTNEKFESNDFKESLKSGHLLCKLINVITPGAVTKVHSLKAMFNCMENISFFLQGCRAVGLENSQLFESLDLYEGRNLKSVVITMYWLGRAARGLGFKGPQLNLFAFTKLKCSRCRKAIEDDQYEVNLNTQWHKTCANCCNCKKYIGPNDPFVLHEGKIYCPQCMCGECYCPLVGNDWVEKDGKRICLGCHNKTVCSNCQKVLAAGEKTYLFGDKKRCSDCVCGTCHKALRPGEFKKVNGVNYCNDCLCTSCHNPAALKDFVVRPDGKFCPDCVCYDCHNPFDSRGYKEVNGRKYCPDCLCARCEKLIVGRDFVNVNSKRYCRDCMCGECRTPLDDPCIRKSGATYHKRCVCARCESPFNKAQPTEVNGSKYCISCVCGDCATPLEDDKGAVHKGNRNYHKRCLCTRCENPVAGRKVIDGHCPDCVCHRCATPLHQHEFTLQKGHSYCYTCVCAKCKTIFPTDNADIVSKDNKSFCKNCVCQKCTKPLVGRTGFVQKGSGKLCSDCVCNRCQKELPVTGKKYCDECVCAGCATPLSTAKGSHKSGNAKYCGKCVCAKCATPVHGKSDTQQTPTGTYCSNCCCSNCRTPLANVGYVGSPDGASHVCFKCICGRCDKIFSKEEKRVKKGERQFCLACVCGNCENVFQNGEWTAQADGRSFCSTCTCASCSNPLKVGKEKGFCKDCLCASCDKPFAARGFIAHKEQKYCVDCVCTRCDEPLSSTEKASPSKCCKKCTCTQCSKPLSLLDDGVCVNCKKSAPKPKTTSPVTPVPASEQPAPASPTPQPSNPTPTPTPAASTPPPASPTSANPPSPSAAKPPQDVPSAVGASEGAGNCVECGGSLAAPGSSIVVGGQYYHKNCFTCYKCRSPIRGSYSEQNGKAYCVSCFRATNAELCAGCNKGIVTGGVLKAMDKTWHSDCFVCGGCKKPFKSGGFMEGDDQKPYHRQCLFNL